VLEKTKGVILRTLPLTETSLIVRWLTPEFGRVSTVAKGARRAKSVFRGKLDLFYLGSFTFRRSRSSSLHTLAEVVLIEPHAFLRTDLDRLHQAAYAAQLIEQTTESDTPLKEIYQIMLEFLSSLATSAARPESVLAFEFQVLDALGLRPDLETQQLAPGAKQLLQSFGMLNRVAGSQAHLSGSDLSQASRFLRNFMLHQLGRIPNEREHALAPAA
jgi:DNA repair protein RecO (recombination protein O)